MRRAFGGRRPRRQRNTGVLTGAAALRAVATRGSEHAHQRAAVEWARIMAVSGDPTFACLDCLYAVPNGGLRSKATAGKLIAEGVKPGVSDLGLPVARRGFHGAFFEAKEPQKGRLDADQRAWLTAMVLEGNFAAACWGVDGLCAAFEWYVRGWSDPAGALLIVQAKYRVQVSSRGLGSWVEWRPLVELVERAG